MTFPAAIVHAFYYARCIHTSVCIDFFGRRVQWTNLNIERTAASYYVLRLLSTTRFLFVLFSPLFFILTRTKYQCESFISNEISTRVSPALLFFFAIFFLDNIPFLHSRMKNGRRRATRKLFISKHFFCRL